MPLAPAAPAAQQPAGPQPCPCVKEVPAADRHYPGAPIPLGLLIALGDRRTGHWAIGLAAATVSMVVLYWWFTASGLLGSRLWILLAAAGGGLAVGLSMSNRAADINESTEAYPEQEQEIRERCAQDWSRLANVPPSPGVDAIRDSLRALDQELTRHGPQWLDGAGYLEAWSHLHDAEENLLLIDSATNVASVGFNDLLRLNGSKIESRTHLVDEINKALPHLVPISSLPPNTAEPNPCDPDTARQRIMNVRHAINQDRNGKWRLIVKARNGMGLGVLAAAVITYLVVAVAIVIGVSARALVAAAIFFAIGASVSAAHQLAIRSKNQSEVEDFGYANVKLLVAPSLSGLVAVLAVAVVAQVGVTISGQSLGEHFQSWQSTFDWTRNSAAVWLAAVFGATPSLFFEYLQRSANGILISLKSSQPSGGNDN